MRALAYVATVGIESGGKKSLSRIESCAKYVSRFYLIAFRPVSIVVSST